MHIGILTIHHVPNYGAVWQAYALSRRLASLGHTVEILDYRPLKAVKYYRQYFGKNRRPNIRPALNYLGFQRFARKRLPLGRGPLQTTKELENASAHLDVLVTGSDQIWCTGEGSFRGYDPHFFARFELPSGCRRISYAASAGNTKTFSKNTDEIREALLSFSALAVRDDSTAELVHQTTGRAPTVVLDPVFMHDFAEIVRGVTPAEELVVFAEQPQRFEKVTRELARAYNLKVVAIGRTCDCADSNPRIVTPEAWMRRIKGARIVVTDFFHGAAVSLRFGRPVLVGASPGKEIKVTDLLNRLGLSDFYFKADGVPRAVHEALDDPHGYRGRVEEALVPHLASSAEYLQAALSATGVRI